MTMSRPALLDTSVRFAQETGRRLNQGSIPDETALSVITIAELHAGILSAAALPPTRARRLATSTLCPSSTQYQSQRRRV